MNIPPSHVCDHQAAYLMRKMFYKVKLRQYRNRYLFNKKYSQYGVLTGLIPPLLLAYATRMVPGDTNFTQQFS